MTKRIQWIFSVLALMLGGVYVVAQNPVSVFQWGSTVVDTNSGNKSAGTLRVTLATDQVQPTNAFKVDGSATTQPVSNAGTFAVQAAQSGTWNITNVSGTVSLPTGAATAAKQPALGTAGTSSADVITVQGRSSMTPLLVDPSGVTSPVSLASVPSHAVTNAGTFAVQIAANSTVDVNKVNGQAVASPDANSYVLASGAATATTTAGTSTCYFTSAASNNAQFCKASAGNLYEIHVTNTTSTNYFLRLYNATSAPTCSSATGFVETVPALGAAANGGVNGRINTPPQAFSTGIAFCLTGGGSSTDNSNAATGVYITLLYK